MYNQHDDLIYHLDLCILSYQLYTQTLVWPMDPYYEQMDKKDERRENFMDAVRQSAPDPDGLPRCPDHLDPIRYRYKQINPHRPCFALPETGEWILYNTPAEITRRIGKTYVAKGAPTKIEDITKQNDDDGIKDCDIYCFEGETGGQIEKKQGALSLMGFILVRPLPRNAADYAVHIVFRGSRSGKVSRAMYEGASRIGGWRRGNADWVTDLAYATYCDNHFISSKSQSSSGFAISMQGMLPTILKCLDKIHLAKKKKPSEIYVTGHSLGGALATHFVSAVVQGNGYGYIPSDMRLNKMPSNVQTWPWRDTKLITYGAPWVGDREFETEFNNNFKGNARRVVLGNDIVAKPPHRTSSSSLGILCPLTIHGLPDGVTNFANRGSLCHEPYLIRRALIASATHKEDVPAQTKTAYSNPEAEDYWDVNEPWKIFPVFVNLLEDPHFEIARKQSLSSDFGSRAIEYFKCMNSALDKESSFDRRTSPQQNEIRKVVNQLTLDQIGFGNDLDDIYHTWQDFKKQFNLEEQTHNFLGLISLMRLLAVNSTVTDQNITESGFQYLVDLI